MKALVVCIIMFLVPGMKNLDAQNNQPAKWINPKDGMVFVQVPAGSITVQVEDGSTPNEQLPFQEIALNEFWMSSTEVTVAQFRTFVDSTGYLTEAEKSGNKWNWRYPGFLQGDDHPVTYIGFDDAKAYVEWAGVDLPYESEWLYACYANTKTRYYWGDEMKPELFWHRENSMEGTHPVAANMPNPWGLYDMIGNVKEYCINTEGGFALPGESWTRCISYRNKWGMVSDNMIENSINKLLHFNSPDPLYVPYPWDDDRGIRCVRRK